MKKIITFVLIITTIINVDSYVYYYDDLEKDFKNSINCKIAHKRLSTLLFGDFREDIMNEVEDLFRDDLQKATTIKEVFSIFNKNIKNKNQFTQFCQKNNIKNTFECLLYYNYSTYCKIINILL